MEKQDIKNQFVNLTPHDINLLVGNEFIVIPTHGFIRVNEVIEVIQNEPVKIIRKRLTDLTTDAVDLVRRHIKNGKKVIVSFQTAQKLKEILTSEELKQVFIIGETVRDEKGRITGAKSLGVIV